MRIYVLTSSRADYGIYLPLLKKLKTDSFFDLRIIAFGTHLSKEHGHTIDQIKKDGFDIFASIETMPENDTPQGISASIGNTLTKFSKFWGENKEQSDLIICLGDRYEMFAAVSASLPFNLKIAHFHGGETSLGAIDESLRHSITAMAQLHFTSTERSAKRVAAIKGSSEGIFNVGAMSLDNLNEMQLLDEKAFEKQFGVLPQKPVLVTFHPETVAFDKNETYCNELIKALEKQEQQIFITLPNADTNGKLIRDKLIAFAKTRNNVHCFDSLGTQGYFSAIKHCDYLLGNSSSGILEAASFGKYVINIGERQKGREKGENILDSEITFSTITAAIDNLRNKASLNTKNIYGDGHTSEKVISLLKTKA